MGGRGIESRVLGCWRWGRWWWWGGEGVRCGGDGGGGGGCGGRRPLMRPWGDRGLGSF